MKVENRGDKTIQTREKVCQRWNNCWKMMRKRKLGGVSSTCPKLVLKNLKLIMMGTKHEVILRDVRE
jgi:hypothetical protein